MKFHELLDRLQQRPAQPLNSRIEKNIRKIRERSLKIRYYYGNSSGSQMLLDPYIAEQLTPEVLAYLVTQEGRKEILDLPSIQIQLVQLIEEHLTNIQLLAYQLNGMGKSLSAWDKHKTNCKKTVLSIVANLQEAAGCLGDSITEKRISYSPGELQEGYKRITDFYATWGRKKAEYENHSAHILNIKNLINGRTLFSQDEQPITMEERVEKFLSHLDNVCFYAPILCNKELFNAISYYSDSNTNMGWYSQQIKLFLQLMVKTLENKPEQFAAAKEQFDWRFRQLEKKLIQNKYTPIATTDVIIQDIPYIPHAIRHQLDLLEQNAHRLQYEYQDEYTYAFSLYHQLSDLAQNYFKLSPPTAEDTQKFMKACEKEIEQARPTLETHRGFKEILGNLALAILGLGVFYSIAVGAHGWATGGKNWLFFQTKSEKLLNETEELIHSIAPANG